MSDERLTVYENPTCTTCRNLFALLTERGVDFERVDYHVEGITEPKLRELLRKGGMRPRDVLRTKEPLVRELGLDSSEVSDEELIAAMVENPVLVQRPIVERGDRAVLARPPERVLVLLAVALVALLVGGCGGSSGQKQTATTAAPAQTQTARAATPATPPAAQSRRPPPAVAAKKRRLAAAGYKVIVSGVEGVKPRPAAGLEFPLKGGGQVSVYAYRSAADARAKAAQFRRLARRYPAYFRVAVRGATTYFGSAEQPEKLDVKGFDAAVARAES